MNLLRHKKGGIQIGHAALYKITVAAWLLLISASSLVYYFIMPEYGFSSALLEATAGWTATGIGAYDAASVPLGLQIFRSISNWIGGVGIIMLALTLLPSRQFMGWTLAATEFPGPDFLKSETDFRRHYRKIVAIYACLSLLQFILLLLAGMAPLEAFMSALSNTSTAGLNHINNGVVTSLSPQIKIILTFFAFICSVNSAVFIHILRRKWKDLKKSSELKIYILRIAATVILISGILILRGHDGNPVQTICSVLMQVISFFSTSGFIISDIAAWHDVCIIILMIMGFAGACSLSTGGGFKICRLVIAVKTMSYGLYRHVHPSSVRSLTFDKKPIKSETVVSANLFIALFMMTYLLGALLLSFDNMSLASALGYSQAMITNTGLSLASPGSAGLATGVSAYGKFVLSFIMIAGRLEVYPLLMLLFRNFWKSE
ncbi:MAG: TrkH family potassium uptake protein [Mogibacterium sp.]|nr:TrkH family potassium uptake protein [Mogibacterium sp.]